MIGILPAAAALAVDVLDRLRGRTPAPATVPAFDPVQPTRILILDADTQLLLHPPAPTPARLVRDDAPQPDPVTITGGDGRYRRIAVARGDAVCECGQLVKHFDVVLEVATHDWRCQDCTPVIRHLHDPEAPLWG